MFMRQISARKGIGKDLSEGLARAAKKWGRLDEDMKSGALRFPAGEACFTGRCPVWSGLTAVCWGPGILPGMDLWRQDTNTQHGGGFNNRQCLQHPNRCADRRAAWTGVGYRPHYTRMTRDLR
jgi:hypothetical protein